MLVTDAEFTELTVEQCWSLVRTQPVGRLGVNAEHYPLIFPVNFAVVDGGTLVVRTGPGTKLTAGGSANVTFEVDEFDAAARTGWSVLVRGLAEEVTERHPAQIRTSTSEAGVQPWAPGEREHWLRIIPHRVTGRRITRGELLPAFEDAAGA